MSNTTTRANAFTIEDNDTGMLFIQKNGDLVGAIRYDFETFQVTGKLVEKEGKRKYWDISGEGDVVEQVTGRLFVEVNDRPSGSGKPRPDVSGKVTTVKSKIERQMGGWLRETPKSRFYSMKLSEPHAPASPAAA